MYGSFDRMDQSHNEKSTRTEDQLVTQYKYALVNKALNTLWRFKLPLLAPQVAYGAIASNSTLFEHTSAI